MGCTALGLQQKEIYLAVPQKAGWSSRYKVFNENDISS